MKVYYKNDLNKAYLVIEGSRKEHDYRKRMLCENRIQRILKTEVRYLDEEEQYYYDTTGKISLKTCFERKKLGFEDIKELVDAILQAIVELKKHMLEGDGLLLEPEYIFCQDEKYFFCYYPAQKKSITEAFHELTEYFVREVDYEDEKGVHLAYVVHKATMEENYSIEQIMQEFFEDEEEIEEITYATTVLDISQEETMVEEKKDVWQSFKKLLKSLSCN